MNLLEALNKNLNVRKIFGKRELFIIKKQLLEVPLTQSEKNRLSRDIRKKLEFIGEISKFKDEFKLKRGSVVNALIKDMEVHIIESKYFPKIKKIILFGSTVEKKRRLDSDIDIAVEFVKIDLREATEFRIKFNYNKYVDVQVYNILPDKIKKEIDEKGEVLYERKN
ncbi:nucleotidyltransferase domain-containing protein [Candidatus Pacearchaeota archaeon]|nr:nucleotidyltransferase domain-containing protein [Candidatus Pacearchaeota archaeon]